MGHMPMCEAGNMGHIDVAGPSTDWMHLQIVHGAQAARDDASGMEVAAFCPTACP